MARWRSGLTHQPFTLAVSGVRIPYGSPIKHEDGIKTFLVFLFVEKLNSM
jgi:hypothetical protein